MSIALQTKLVEIEQKLAALDEQGKQTVVAILALVARVENLEGAGKRRWFTLKDVRDAKADG